MKNITLLVLGIFIGIAAIIYGFGLSSKNEALNNFNSLLVFEDTTTANFSSSLNPENSSETSGEENSVLSPKETLVPDTSENSVPKPVASPSPSLAPTTIPALKPTPAPPALTRSEVAKHSSQRDCYLIINNKVYNISSYFGSHPGGNKAMLDYCGREATGIFASIHSNSAWDLLSKYFIGNLVGG